MISTIFGFSSAPAGLREAISREEEAHMSKRQEMKELIAKFRTINPHIETNIFKSVENVNLDACIGYVKGKERHHFLEEY